MDEVAHREMAKEVQLQGTGGTLLDLGCGDGYFFPLYKKLGFNHMIGVDASEEMLKTAKRNNPEVSFVNSTLPTIHIPTASIDIIVSMYALQNIAPRDMSKLYSECSRVLKPGGKMIILTKSPMQQFLKKIEDAGASANYFNSEMVSLKIFDGALTVTEPSHTITDYLLFTQHGFIMNSFNEYSDFPASRKIMGEDYPTFIIFSATKE